MNFKSRLAVDETEGDCVRWLESNGDQGEAVGAIAKTKREAIEELINEAANINDEQEILMYTVELAALIWFTEGKDKKKQKARTKRAPHFRFKGNAAVNRFLTYLQAIEKLTQHGKPLPVWASTALLERWRPPPRWTP